MLLPGITISTSPTDFYPIQSVQLARFKGETWELFGDIMSAESSVDSSFSRYGKAAEKAAFFFAANRSRLAGNDKITGSSK